MVKILDIRTLRVPLDGQVSNAVVNFAEHDVSLVAVLTDAVRDGRPVIGYGFDSIGRFAQDGILRERLIPRLRRADPETLLAADGRFDCAAVQATAMRNEKPGGHGDRAAAMGALELAFWDANAKLAQEPAYATIARHFGRTPSARVPVYAAGGYYYDHDGLGRLRDELKGYADAGFDAFKIKIGGAPLVQDLHRIDAALALSGGGARLAVDANGRFDFDTAMAYAEAIAPLQLRWYEEIGDPLDYALNARIAGRYAGAIATGENLFSLQDVRNLLTFGGLRPGLDILQMDAGLAYGLTEYGRIVALLEQHGFSRSACFPHGGHLLNLHIAAGLNLGGCEAYPAVFQPFGGYSPQCRINGGFIRPAEHPGFGLEAKPNLAVHLQALAA